MGPLIKLSVICIYLFVALAWHEAIPVNAYIVQSDLSADSMKTVAISELGATSVRTIYPSLGLFRISTNLPNATVADVMEQWTNRGICNHTQPDRRIELRRSPDDPLFAEQWGMERIGVPDVWMSMTGGVTMDGDTIVVAVLDEGFDIDHIDLRENIWINHGEIPLDAIDNDDNGYVDDYRGLYLQQGNDAHPVDIHGTAVAGIIGAVGNNSRGVTGVNWRVKVLPISGIEFESEVIEGYNYVKQLRQTYNETGGEQGAFVAVTNLSAGISGEWPENYPMWCAVYDDLGAEGILSVSAVTNRESDIDVEGDIPTTCPSDFLLTVTNVGVDDDKHNPAGYGRMSVDLGAPGTPTLTVGLGNGYAPFASTSAAAPHVAGAIALLHTTDCLEFMDLVRSRPDEAALRLRGVVMNSVDPISSLADRSVSGGRLNAQIANDALCAAFGELGDRLSIEQAYPVPSRGEVTIDISTFTFAKHEIRVIDPAGRLVHQEQITPIGSKFSHTVTFGTGVAGVFYISVEAENDLVTHRIVVL